MANILHKEIIVGDEETNLVESNIVDGISTPLVRKKMIKTKNYLSNISKKINHGVGLVLPRNCRLIQPVNSNASILVVEDQPKIRSIRLKYDFRREHELIKITGQEELNAKRFLEGQNGDVYNLKLSFPYIVYIMLINEREESFEVPCFNVFFRSHPIGRLNDYLNIANIFNLSDSNTLCFGRGAGYPKNNTQTTSDLVRYLTSDFWNKPFSDEYQSRHYMYQNHSRLHSFLVWSHYSETDPMFIYSTDWVVHKRTLGEEISAMCNRNRLSENSQFQNIFLDSLNEQEESTDSDKKYSYDTLNLGQQLLNLGDQIKYDDKEMYLYSLNGDRNIAKYAILVDIVGNLTDQIEITESLKQDWENQVDNQLNNYVDEIQLGEKIAKVGGIIKILPTNNYEIIQKIRFTRDKRYEFVLSKRFYLVREDVFEVINSIEIDGLELKPGESYMIHTNQHQITFKGKLVKIENNNYNVLYFFFKDLETGEERGISVDSFENHDSTINTIDDTDNNTPDVFRYLDKLITNDEKIYTIIEGKGLYTKYSAVTDINNFPMKYNIDVVLNNILLEDGNKLSIPGVDVDINFQVGDEVIVGDWASPGNLMFKIRKISGFEFDNNSLGFKLIDSEGEEITVDFINLTTGKIKVGYIRKVKSEYEGICVGARAKVTTSGLFEFQIGSKHEISAFIIDSEKPIVLFKNGLTIWFNDLEKHFTLFTPGTEGYREIRSVRKFEPEKIKWQSGDLCERDEKLYLINNGNNFVGIIYMGIDHNFIKTGSLRSRAVISENVNPEFVRYGIITPRYRKKERVVIHESIPTFYNGYRLVKFDGYYPHTISNQEDK